MTRRRHVLISAGPTREPIDPVRFLSNYSTGFMGACLANEAKRRGYRVTMVSGPTTEPPPRGVRLVRVEESRQMRHALTEQLPHADALIMAAAVCDFQSAVVRRAKLPRRGKLTLSLEATPDILGGLTRRPGQVVVGFSLETAQTLTRARAKLRAKRLDLMVSQQMTPSSAPRSRINGSHGHGSPFGRRAVHAFLLDAAGGARRLGHVSKPRLAHAVLDEIERLWYRGILKQRETT
ncbi:MAG: phosphopantothenoylcysteine decarboxylase [Candidatus Omnitrophica bacterium]|nr:phosphopantothenoylcysteine decarboxylase [Candidatus Omnitrophota bacterium]